VSDYIHEAKSIRNKLIVHSCRTPARSTNVAAIAGGVVGGITLALILSVTMFIVIRRRFRQARLTFVGEDGLEGRESTQPRPSEEDMPPPNYRRIFPSNSGAAEEQSQAEREARVDAGWPSEVLAYRSQTPCRGCFCSEPDSFQHLCCPGWQGTRRSASGIHRS
jgi:hypothetical protein